MEPSGYIDSRLDAVFSALADPSRRAILLRLAQGEATVSQLAAPFDISQPAISKHLKVLEKSGLIKRGQNRQSRPAYLQADVLEDAMEWISYFKKFWGGSFEQLDDLLATLNTTNKEHKPHE